MPPGLNYFGVGIMSKLNKFLEESGKYKFADIIFGHSLKIPFKSFISEWSDCCTWLDINVGPGCWEAATDPTSSNHAIFYFKTKAAAFKFKMVWG
jgi:hypothetical protein